MANRLWYELGMSSRDRWLEAGVEVLTGDGIAAVTIERLCAEVGLSKGSFYHHFKGVSGFREALLEYFEDRETVRYVEAAERPGHPSARERIRLLMYAVAADGDGSATLERAVRVWAGQDPVAATALERIDRTRTTYLEGLLREITGSANDARELAGIIYLVLLGSYHVLPPVPIAEVRRLWERTLASVVGDDAAATGDGIERW